MKNSIAIFLLVSLLGSSTLFSQEHERHQFIIEVDPLPFILGGVGGHFGWSPKNSKHFSFGLAIISGLSYPDALLQSNSQNKDMGWEVKINQGMGLWSHYYFDTKNTGWFTGLQLFTQEMELTNVDFVGESDRTNTILIAAQGGYMWYPFKKLKLYLRPWAGIGYQSVVSGSFEPELVDPDLVVGDKEYSLTTIQPFATVHIGYRF